MKGITHPAYLRKEARELIKQGATLREAARQLGVSKSTVHEWVVGTPRTIQQPISWEVTPSQLWRPSVRPGQNLRISDNDRFNAELDETEARLKDKYPIVYLVYQSVLAKLSADAENPEDEYKTMRTGLLLKIRGEIWLSEAVRLSIGPTTG